MRTLLLVAMLALAGCGDDTAAPAHDMSMSLDLTGQPTSCGADGVAQSCASASGNSGCFVCDFSHGGGTCARICSLVVRSCPAGQVCTEFSFGDAGTTGGFAVEGSGCGGFGFCR